MILFKCDRCGKVISNYVHRIRVEAFSNANYALDKPITTFPLSEVGSDISEDLLPEMMEGSHFCRDCIEQICAYAMNYNVDINSKRGGVRPTHSSKPVREPEPQSEPAEDDSGELTEEEEQKICDRIAGSRHMAKGEKKKIDLGKMKALWEANQRGADWPITKIADELGCSDSTVHYYLKKMKLK